MDLLKGHRRRSRLSDIIYIVLNICLVGVIFGVVRIWQAPWLAVLLVLLSKWRILAVRPRFWAANVVANTVDIVVGLGAVVLLNASQMSLVTQVVVALLYAVWLLFVKPRSSRLFVTLQAGVAIFVGVSALAMITYSWDPIVFVVLMWVIGYTAARHVLGSYDEPYTKLYSLISGLVFAEFGWIGFHWSMAYPVFGANSIKLSQLALFCLLIGFVAERAYHSHHTHGRVRRTDIMLPTVFTVAIMMTLMVMALIFGGDAL